MFSRNLEMWMMLRVSVTKNFFVLAALFIAAACSKQPAPPSAPTTPLVEQGAADARADRVEEFRGRFAPGGIATSYRATFSNGQIQSLEETRDANALTGAYEFHGARLMKYRGAALSSSAQIELAFDEQGKLLVNSAGVSPQEISALRDRAQSLRSHALAHRDVLGHDKP